MSLAALITYERKSKGFTQEELADLAGVTLRTIQRIEKGDTLPRGYTLQALAKALGKPVEALYAATTTAATATPFPAPAIQEDARTLLQFLNLSCLAYLVIPFGNILLPAWLWRKNRHVSTVNEVGVRPAKAMIELFNAV